MLLQLPSVNLRALVVEGVTSSALHSGVGHFPTTPLPGSRGNVGLAGLRASLGMGLSRVSGLARGDSVVLSSTTYVYAIVPSFSGHGNPWAVPSDDFTVIGQAGDLGRGYWLTFTTDVASASQRLVLRAKLVRVLHSSPCH